MKVNIVLEKKVYEVSAKVFEEFKELDWRFKQDEDLMYPTARARYLELYAQITRQKPLVSEIFFIFD